MSQYHDFLNLNSQTEYYDFYITNLCSKPIKCFDNITVKFRQEQFTHAFYERSKRYYRQKDQFSFQRAKRMSWIPVCLSDSSITPLAGYDKGRKRYDHTRRVCLVTPDDFVVVIRLTKPNEAQFVTCFIIDDQTVTDKIKNSPIWEPQKVITF